RRALIQGRASSRSAKTGWLARTGRRPLPEIPASHIVILRRKVHLNHHEPLLAVADRHALLTAARGNAHRLTGEGQEASRSRSR
ncbi:MAG: hypothetical protein ACJ8DV_27395, partial [Microvirga sp.]